MEGVAKAAIRTQEQKAEAPDKKVAGAGFSFSWQMEQWGEDARGSFLYFFYLPVFFPPVFFPPVPGQLYKWPFPIRLVPLLNLI